MLVLSSRPSRRLVGSARGEDSLHVLFEKLAREHSVLAGELKATGVLEDVALTTWDTQRGRFHEPRALRGSCELLSLHGNLSMHDGSPSVQLFASLARSTDNGLDLVGGRVVSARVVLLEFSLECWDDISLERTENPALSLAPWDGATPASSAPPQAQPPRAHAPAPVQVTPPSRIETRFDGRATPAPPVPRAPVREEPAREVQKPAPSAGEKPRSLAEAAAIAAQLPDRSDEIEERMTRPEPEPGDLIDHPTFGPCSYVAEMDNGNARLRVLPNGPHKEIKLDVFDPLPLPPRGGKRVWGLKPRRR